MRLGNLVKVRTGKLDSNASCDNGKYPFFTCSREILSINDYAFDCECVLLAGNGELNAKYYNGKFNAYQRTYIIESLCKEKLNTKYMYYFFEWYLSTLKYQAIGGVIKYIKLANITEAQINLPSITKQKEIVCEIERITNLINKSEKILDSLNELIKSRFIEMFENKGFELVPIRELVDTKKISAKKNFNSEEEIKYIDISSIDNERNIIIGYTNYIMKDAPSRAQQCLRKNDILISTVRPNLRNIAIFKEEDLDYVGSSGFCILRAKKVNSDYLKYVVLNDKFTNAMVDLTTGASYPAIRDEDVLNYLMINAPLELQNTFADFVQQIDKSKFIIQKRINLYKELLDKKMAEFFE